MRKSAERVCVCRYEIETDKFWLDISFILFKVLCFYTNLNLNKVMRLYERYRILFNLKILQLTVNWALIYLHVFIYTLFDCHDWAIYFTEYVLGYAAFFFIKQFLVILQDAGGQTICVIASYFASLFLNLVLSIKI